MRKLPRILLLPFILFLFVALVDDPSSADMHTKDEINGIIAKIDKKLNELKKKGADTYSNNEFIRISEQIDHAKKLLNKGEFDKAYFEVRIGVEYVELIMAREKLYKSKESFDKFNGMNDK